MILSPDLGGDPKVRSLYSAAGQNAELQAALDVVPNLASLSTQIARLVSDAMDLDPAQTGDQVTTAAGASLSAGKGLPADLLKQYAAAQSAEAAYGSAQVALSRLLTDLKGQRDQALASGLDDTLAVLGRRLSEVLGELADQLRAAKRASSADEAIRLGVVEEWRRVVALRQHYRAVRDAQHHLTRALADDEVWTALNKAWLVVGYAEGLPEVWPDLPEWHRYGFTFDQYGNRQLASPPWPDPKSEQFADWLALNPQARPWVPTPQDAWQLLDRIEANTNSPTRPSERRPVDRFGDLRRGERSHARSLAAFDAT